VWVQTYPAWCTYAWLTPRSGRHEGWGAGPAPGSPKPIHLMLARPFALVCLGTKLVMLYWSIWREILDQQRAAGWGDIVGASPRTSSRILVGRAGSRGGTCSTCVGSRPCGPNRRKCSHWLHKPAGLPTGLPSRATA
jgi:hypothetical protein